MNHMAKVYAFSPTGKNPAEKMPFGDINLSAGFSTDRDEPMLKLSGIVDDNDDANRKHWDRKRNKNGAAAVPMNFIAINQIL